MLYMQEVEKMEGYGQESYQAKVGLHDPPQRRVKLQTTAQPHQRLYD